MNQNETNKLFMHIVLKVVQTNEVLAVRGIELLKRDTKSLTQNSEQRDVMA